MSSSAKTSPHILLTLLLLSSFGVSAVAQPPGSGTLFVVNSTMDTPDANPGDGICADANGNCTLRAAVQEGNATMGVVTIRLQPNALYLLSTPGAGEDGAATGDLDITGDVRIDGKNATVDGGALDRVFDVRPGGRLFIKRLTVLNGAVTGESGGAVRCGAGSLWLDRARVANSTATGAGASGGGVFNDGGTVLIDRTCISGCSADRAGGAIEANAGSTAISWSELENNSTGPGPGNGGAFHLTGAGNVNIEFSRIEGNVAAREGGGVWNSAVGTMTVKFCQINNNSADGAAADDGGGGLFNDGGDLDCRFSTISNNTAGVGLGSGGGVFNNNGTMTLFRCNILDNSSRRAGGGIEALAGTTDVIQCTLNDNNTGPMPGNGGGLHLTGAGTVTVRNSSVSGNTATAEGGGLWNSAVGTMDVIRCTFCHNTASGTAFDQGGGGLFNDGGNLSVQFSIVSHNVADGMAGSGGGILNNLGTLDVSNCLLLENRSERAGGGIEANVGSTTITDVHFFGNETGSSPGNGGGVHLTGAGTVLIHRAILIGNSASNEGGGLWNSLTGTMTATSTLAIFNAAPDGRNVFNDGGTFTFNGNVVN